MSNPILPSVVYNQWWGRYLYGSDKGGLLCDNVASSVAQTQDPCHFLHGQPIS